MITKAVTFVNDFVSIPVGREPIGANLGWRWPPSRRATGALALAGRIAKMVSEVGQVGEEGVDRHGSFDGRLE
jgi:hypothetical protein